MDSKFELSITQTHISTLQNIISRMTNYSLNVKTWCVTLSTGLIVALIQKQSQCYYWIGFIPITLFYFLDCYYLGLEKCFREIYDEFIKKLSTDTNIEELLKFSLNNRIAKNLLKAFCSISTTPFYFIMYGIMWFVS